MWIRLVKSPSMFQIDVEILMFQINTELNIKFMVKSTSILRWRGTILCNDKIDEELVNKSCIDFMYINVYFMSRGDTNYKNYNDYTRTSLKYKNDTKFIMDSRVNFTENPLSEKTLIFGFKETHTNYIFWFHLTAICILKWQNWRTQFVLILLYKFNVDFVPEGKISNNTDYIQRPFVHKNDVEITKKSKDYSSVNFTSKKKSNYYTNRRTGQTTEVKLMSTWNRSASILHTDTFVSILCVKIVSSVSLD